MAEKESRLAQILRSELKSGKGMSDSLLNAFAANMKEQKDWRKVFPKQGVFGQVMRGVFGQGYRYGAKAQRESAGSSGSGLSSVTAGAIRITARNSMFLPSMARDMNIMKQNMQLLVRASGRRAYSRPESGFNKIKLGGPKKAAPKASPSAGGGAADIAGGVVGGIFSTFSFVSSLAGSIVKGLGSVLGTGLSIGGSLISGAAGLLGSVFSGIMGVGGGILSGVLGGLASIVSGMGIFGIIALAGAGYLAYAISKSVTGTINFDEIGKRIRDFFNFKEGETFVSALYKVLGKVDEKTGMNTVGIMEKVEVQFSRFLAYSGDVLTKIVDIVQLTSRLAMLEMQKAFLDYGTIIIDYMGQIGGALTGLKLAPTVAAALGSAAAGAGAGLLGGPYAALIGGIVGLLGGGAMIWGGMKAGESLSKNINKTLAMGTVTDPEQKKLLEDMSSGPQSKHFLEIVDEIQKIQENAAKAGGMRANDEARLKKIRGDSVYKDFMDRYEKLFGKQYTSTTDIVQSARDAKAMEIYDVQGKLRESANIDNIKQSGTAAADVAEQRTIKDQALRRSQSLGGTGSYKGIDLNSGKSIKMKEVISYLMRKGGLSFEAASGIAANLYYESSGLNAEVEGPKTSQGKAYGLAQWLGPRREAFEKYAGYDPTKIKDPYTQLDYLLLELTTQSPFALLNKKLRSPDITSEQAARLFLDEFEKPSDDEKARSWETRKGIATAFSPSMEAGSTTTAKEEKRKQELADPYAGKSDVELLLAAFGSMFGDLATSILELAEAGNKQAAASGKNDSGGKVSSAPVLNYDLIFSETGIHRVLKTDS